jgi:hypothetical protein
MLMTDKDCRVLEYSFKDVIIWILNDMPKGPDKSRLSSRKLRMFN